MPINFFRIFCGGINFISIEVIALATYLANWVFIAPIINIKFLFNCRLFSLEMIGVNSFDLLMLQAHLRLAWEFLPLDVVACVPPFGQFVNKGVNSLQENI